MKIYLKFNLDLMEEDICWDLGGNLTLQANATCQAFRQFEPECWPRIGIKSKFLNKIYNIIYYIYCKNLYMPVRQNSMKF